jgi:hypothetical protein
MEIKVLNTMHQAIINKRPIQNLNRSFFIFFNSNSYGTLFVENINIPTPVEIAISATLKMALKSKIVAAQIGNQLRFLSKWEIKSSLYRENRRHKAVLKTM